MLTPGWGTGARGGSPPEVKPIPPLVRKAEETLFESIIVTTTSSMTL